MDVWKKREILLRKIEMIVLMFECAQFHYAILSNEINRPGKKEYKYGEKITEIIISKETKRKS